MDPTTHTGDRRTSGRPDAPRRRRLDARRLVTVVVHRLLWLVVTVWGVATIVFFLSRVAGDPVVLLVPQDATPELIASITERFGLDQPIMVQYLSFLRDSLRGDFGDSFYYSRPAMDLVLDRVGATAALAAMSVLVSLLLAVPLALWAAARPRGITDRVGGTLATLAQSIPVFWFAPMLVLVFAVQINLFPSAGSSGIASWVLPVLTLAFFQVGLLFKLGRTEGLEVMASDYVRLARAKGDGTGRVLRDHVMPNIAPVLLTMVGLTLAGLIGGAVIVENIFAWPGLGTLLTTSASQHDYPVTQALVLTISVCYVVINTLVELLHELLDPRIRRS